MEQSNSGCAVSPVSRVNAKVRTSRVSAVSAVIAALSVLGLIAGSGCSSDVGELDEDVGEVTQALGELACANDACSSPACANLTLPPSPLCDFAFVSSTSPNATYGTAGCPNQYRVKSGGAAWGQQVQLFVAWGDAALTQTSCPQATLEGALYETALGPWTLRGTATWAGQWFFGQCLFVQQSQTGNINLTAFFNAGMAATGTARLNGVKKKVKVGFRVGDGPC